LFIQLTGALLHRLFAEEFSDENQYYNFIYYLFFVKILAEDGITY